MGSLATAGGFPGADTMNRWTPREVAQDLRRFVLHMHRARQWYQPRVTVKDICAAYNYNISQKTAERALQWLKRRGYLDTWEQPPPL